MAAWGVYTDCGAKPCTLRGAIIAQPAGHSPLGAAGGGCGAGGGGGDGDGDCGEGEGDGGGGAAGGTIPANWASSSRLMPLAVRKSVARNSPEHVSFPSPTPTHCNGSTPSTLVLNEMAVWRPEMRSSFAVFGSGGQAGRGGAGCGGGVGVRGGGGDEPASSNRRDAVVLAALIASTGIGCAWGVASNWATVALSSLIWACCVASVALAASSSRASCSPPSPLGARPVLSSSRSLLTVVTIVPISAS
eukprot:scaffold25298_cov62-Phaeocystis_antarctica.AAC.1